jgi:hypothetical protein
MIKIFQNLALFRVKNANIFAKFFGKKYFKNHNIGPRSFANEITITLAMTNILFT